MSSRTGSGAEPEANAGLGTGAPNRLGWFRFYFEDQRWEWSEGVQQLHGYEAGAMPAPTLDVVLSHKHPEDRDKVAATIDDMTHSRGVFSGRHRIIDTRGVVHSVIVIGDQFFDAAQGRAVGTYGFYFEPLSVRSLGAESVTALVEEIAESRGAIERAKGMLMLVYDLDEEAAFDLMRWVSQNHNIKVRQLAEHICAAFRATAPNGFLDKTAFDHALMSTPQRGNSSGTS